MFKFYLNLPKRQLSCGDKKVNEYGKMVGIKLIKMTYNKFI